MFETVQAGGRSLSTLAGPLKILSENYPKYWVPMPRQINFRLAWPYLENATRRVLKIDGGGHVARERCAP